MKKARCIFHGKETSHYTEKEFEEYRRKYIVNIFQSFNLINSYTVYQNVELVLLLNGFKKKDIKEKVLSMIEEVGLTEFKNTKVSKLSGGQKQRVAIARAMVKDTPIILADEPTGNLDSESAKDVIEILKRVAKNKLVIIVTHNIEQIEKYATRIIKMHDGRIIEDTKIKEVEETEEVKEALTYNITPFNKYRLGIRNTFNIFSKFILLFFVFFFIVSAIFLEYGSFKLREEEYSKNTIYSSIGFADLAPERIIIKKIDKTYFTNEDYEKIKAIPNVDYIIEDDLFVDRRISFIEDTESRFNAMSIYGAVKNIDTLKGNLDIGRMPENDNEIVVLTNPKYYYVESKLDEFLSKEYKIENGLMDIKLKIVGIKYKEEDFNYEMTIYGTDGLIKNLRAYINRGYSTLKILLNDKGINSYSVLPSEKVKQGEAIVDNDFTFMVQNGKIKNKPLDILVSNIYYEEELNLKVSNTYTKSNLNRLTGYSNYDMNRNAVFVNPEDYNSLYDKEPYQSSVYVKNYEEIDTVMQELANQGIKAKKAKDYEINDFELQIKYEKIAKVIVTIIVVFVLFFISYFIIRIILKSRNIYYTTLRILGAKYKSIKRILDIELFINSSLAFLGALAFIILAKANIIHLEYITKIAKFVDVKEYILMYLILVIMSRLISRRFSRKLFKKTVINTYGEEV